jgi:hypothetical protein
MQLCTMNQDEFIVMFILLSNEFMNLYRNPVLSIFSALSFVFISICVGTFESSPAISRDLECVKVSILGRKVCVGVKPSNKYANRWVLAFNSTANEFSVLSSNNAAASFALITEAALNHCKQNYAPASDCKIVGKGQQTNLVIYGGLQANSRNFNRAYAWGASNNFREAQKIARDRCQKNTSTCQVRVTLNIDAQELYIFDDNRIWNPKGRLQKL